MKTFDEFITGLKDASSSRVAKKYAVAETIANQINGILGKTDVNNNPRKGFVGIAADDPQKGIVGVLLYRLTHPSGVALRLCEQDESVVVEDMQEQQIILQISVADPCNEMKCATVDYMRVAYDDAVKNKWVIDLVDDPQALEFGFIVVNADGRTRYFITYKLLVKEQQRVAKSVEKDEQCQ